MKEKIRSVNHDYDCRNSDSDVASVKTLNSFVNGVASKKDKPIYCEMHIRSNPVGLQVTVEPLLASSPEVTSVTPSLNHLTFPSDVNKEKIKALGTCKRRLENPKASQK